MKRQERRTGWIATLAGAAAIGLASLSVSAADLKLKSGQTWRGELNDTVQVVYAEGSREQTIEGKLIKADTTMVVIETNSNGKPVRKSIFFGDVRSMKSVAAAKTTAEAAAPATTPGGATPDTNGATPDPDKKAEHKGVPADFKGVFILPMEGMVGTGMRHEQIEEIGKEADKYGPGQIIILQIDSGGGMVVEADQIHIVLVELKKRHRVIAWIKEAISAAAFTALHCDEIYFMHVGALGSMTMFAGKTAIKDAQLDAWIALAGSVAELGGRSPKVIQCMIHKPLQCSYDIPEGGGPKDAIFYDNLSGKYKLDDKDHMLTFTASQALACGFSDGTADNERELAALIGIPEWREVNESGRKIYRDWQRLLKDSTEDITKLVVNYGLKGSGLSPKAQLQAQIRTLTELIRWWERCEPCIIEVSMKGAAPPPKEVLEQELKRLKEVLAEINKAEKANNLTR